MKLFKRKKNYFFCIEIIDDYDKHGKKVVIGHYSGITSGYDPVSAMKSIRAEAQQEFPDADYNYINLTAFTPL